MRTPTTLSVEARHGKRRGKRREKRRGKRRENLVKNPLLDLITIVSDKKIRRQVFHAAKSHLQAPQISFQTSSARQAPCHP